MPFSSLTKKKKPKREGDTCMNKTVRLQSCPRRTMLENEELVCYIILLVNYLFPVLKIPIQWESFDARW